LVGVMEYKVPYDEWEHEYTLAAISDIHAGNSGLDKALFRRVVKWCKTYADGVILGGDYADAIDAKDKRFEWQSLDRTLATPDEQYDFVMAELSPLKGKILALIEGNHDYKIKSERGHDYIADMREYLDVDRRAVGAGVFTRLKFVIGEGRGTHATKFDVFSHHGATNSRTAGGKLNKLQEMDDIFEADIYTMSHVHDFLASMVPLMEVDKSMNVREKRRYFALTGGFLKGWDKGVSNYVERGLFKPSILGGIYCNIHCAKDLRSNVRIWDIPVESRKASKDELN
jgi:hypothetical protein